MNQDNHGKKNNSTSSGTASGAWSVALKVWDIAYPILMYYVTVVIVMILVQTFLGAGNETYMLRQLIASLVAIPVVYTHYRYDRNLEGRPTLWEFLAGRDTVNEQQHGKYKIKYVAISKILLWVIAVSALLGISLNNIISMTPLVSISSGYQEANEHFYGGSVIFEVLASGITIPILEELLYRGVVYQRLKRDMPAMAAAVLSALLFGAFHFNLVQFIYAFFLGLALAMLMERAGHMAAAVVGHMTANLIAILRTETGVLAWSADGSAAAWGVSVVLLLIGVGILLFGLKRK